MYDYIDPRTLLLTSEDLKKSQVRWRPPLCRLWDPRYMLTVLGWRSFYRSTRRRARSQKACLHHAVTDGSLIASSTCTAPGAACQACRMRTCGKQGRTWRSLSRRSHFPKFPQLSPFQISFIVNAKVSIHPVTGEELLKVGRMRLE